MTAAWFWGRSKRAAIAALISGGAELGVSLLTKLSGRHEESDQLSYPP
jgi:hypothetical protein